MEQKGQNHNRLVLGEREAAIQEARDYGGAFIDLHPEASRTLKKIILTLILSMKEYCFKISKRKLPELISSRQTWMIFTTNGKRNPAIRLPSMSGSYCG